LTAVSDWKPADRRRMRAIRDRLRAEYGRPVLRAHRAPLDELVLTVLSQNTNDRNRDVAYSRLCERFDSWDEVRDAPVEEVEDAIRPGGLAPTKALRIQRILQALDDGLDWLEEAPVDEARGYLESLPGVGRKTAACVLLFSFGRPEVPVDTHVYRVGSRLGLFRPGGSVAEAHDELLRLTDPDDAYEIHVLLIRHGRRTCTARAPRCGECPLRRMCPYGREVLRHRTRRTAPPRPQPEGREGRQGGNDLLYQDSDFF
jgi:endonuclease III